MIYTPKRDVGSEVMEYFKFHISIVHRGRYKYNKYPQNTKSDKKTVSFTLEHIFIKPLDKPYFI